MFDLMVLKITVIHTLKYDIYLDMDFEWVDESDFLSTNDASPQKELMQYRKFHFKCWYTTHCIITTYNHVPHIIYNTYNTILQHIVL